MRMTEWRARLLPAYFRNDHSRNREAMFHVESGSREGGRRVVTHQFPKKDSPYTEDMGRKATEFTVRGYCIAYPRNTGEILYQENYMVARDALMSELEIEGPGTLQMPSLPAMQVVCTRFRMTEEQRLGGYCTFDMSFVEKGFQPFRESMSSRPTLTAAADRVRQRVDALLASPNLGSDSQRITHAASRELARLSR